MRSIVKINAWAILTALAVGAAWSEGVLASDCGSAALAYYCVGVTMGLSSGAAATDQNLATALRVRASEYSKQAGSLGFPSLSGRYQKAGLEDASKAAAPETMKRLLATCVNVDTQTVQLFRSNANKTCVSTNSE